ncbi:hypothetical protein F3Y22_tig00110889pilonHSYRG00045 [Hibiscus syriacus]|uniref:Piwi domain-containing protein n=1 Tax=Hibiscus syriacus TaxID=106335 RepID=A0A6A2ZHR5_HIBSY|nr:hypothetical protein F3Y22_tig00110889pilonHSYRG00045 [Hibiscus syriacus]
MAPTRVNDQYFTNLLLKINAKLGWMNLMLATKQTPSIPEVPTIILSMDVSHGSPGQYGIPSIVFVISSSQYHLISRYKASVRTQSPKLEMIDSLFKQVSDKEDEGMIGTTRHTYYHVLLDQIGFSADNLQELVHSLSYVYQRSTTAIFVVAPIFYAHLASSQVGTFLKFIDALETSSSHGGATAPGVISIS